MLRLLIVQFWPVLIFLALALTILILFKKKIIDKKNIWILYTAIALFLVSFLFFVTPYVTNYETYQSTTINEEGELSPSKVE